MARTVAAAIAEVEGPEFDAIVGYTVKRPKPAPIDKRLATAFAGFDYEPILRIARLLASRYRCHQAYAEDATQDALAELLVKRPDLFQEDQKRWMGLVHEIARFRLIDIKADQGTTASIEALIELADDAPFDGASLCVPASHGADEEAKYVPPPRNGEEWNSSQIIGALQRFRDYFGRPPRSGECKALNGLPTPAAINRHFDSFADAVLAAGMVPDVPRRRRRVWKPLAAARTCRAFRRRNGYWPSLADVKRRRGELPGASVMVRCFGGTRAVEVQQGAEAILAGAEDSAA